MPTNANQQWSSLWEPVHTQRSVRHLIRPHPMCNLPRPALCILQQWRPTEWWSVRGNRCLPPKPLAAECVLHHCAVVWRVVAHHCVPSSHFIVCCCVSLCIVVCHVSGMRPCHPPAHPMASPPPWGVSYSLDGGWGSDGAGGHGRWGATVCVLMFCADRRVPPTL